jgi:CubicO group peptidase (beta-lactamase class C family)
VWDRVHVLTATRTHASARLEELKQALGEFIPEAMRATGTPGLNIALAVDDEPPWCMAFGVRDVSSGAPMTTDTVTRGGSMAKLYIAIAALQLVEDGAMALHEPIATYLDGLRVANPLGERAVTAYDLLTHRSGLATDTIDAHLGAPPEFARFMESSLGEDKSPEYNLERSRWTAKVGAQPQYSSFGLALLGLVIERCNPLGLSFGEYVQQQIVLRLDMRSTRVAPSREAWHVWQDLPDRVSTGHARFGPLALPTPELESADYPAVSLFTTAGDHLRLVLALMNDGELEGRRILAPASVRAMLTPRVPMGQFTPHEPWWVGLVVELQRLGSADHFFGHGGAHPWGWWSDCRAYPAQRCAVVVFTNKWEMLQWHNPAVENAHGFIGDFIADWLMRPARPKRAEHSWDWKSSYAVGVILAERTHGFLGVPAPLDPELLDSLSARARFLNEAGRWNWDPEAFRLGYADLLDGGTRPDELRSFLTSRRMRIERAELRLLCHEFGRRGPLAIPMSFFAGARGVAAPWAPSTVVHDLPS